jgi:hypothetical protein
MRVRCMYGNWAVHEGDVIFFFEKKCGDKLLGGRWLVGILCVK